MLDASGTNTIKSVQYYNGLGYPTVSVATTGSNGETAATLTTYDALGREDRNYLPVPCSNLDIVNEAHFKSQAMFYLDNSAFTQNHYDGLDRVTAVDIAGDQWRKAGKQNRTEFLANTDADYVCIYKANSTPSSTGMYYPAGSLTKEVVKDADNKTVITFKDLFGNVILQRVCCVDHTIETYYVYNEIGQLRYVLTPKIQQPGINFSAKYYYEYRYDARGRVKTKILPGCKEITYWYDKADRISCMKDPALGSRYRFYLYDKLGRLCVQGTCTDVTRDSTLLSTTSYVSGTNNGICKTGYTAPYTISNPKLEIVNYYDNYNFKDKDKRFTSSMPSVTVNDNQKQYSIGSLTGTVVYATNGKALGTVNVYDQKGLVVWSVRKGLEGYEEDVRNVYNTVTGAIDKTTTNVNVKYGDKFYAATEYIYSYGKKTKMKQSVAHGIYPVSRETEYNYDLIGRLQGKKRYLSGTKNFSSCSYSYDVHGWLTYINSGGFLEYLYYADTDGIDDTKYYNGNISAYRWKNRDDNAFQGYIFKYDDNNRLREATYGWGNNLKSNKNYFSEYVDEYDRNGNIIRLRRRGLMNLRGVFGNVDDLYMTYSGNKLTKVRDNAVHDAYNGATDFYTESKEKEYPLTYNNAGSLVSDAGRKIAKIQYDSNNNPVRIQFTNGNVTKYVYSATGEKLRVIYQTSVYPENAEIVAIGKTKELTKEEERCTETVDYLLGGALTLRNGRIDKYQFEEGYCQAKKVSDANKDDFDFYYYDQDHLGNIRQVTMDDGASKGTVIQKMNYYPFGGEFNDLNAVSYVQNHKYNGKEFDNMHGLNTYDYGARQYNPVTGRWDRIDPLSEKYYSTSPYGYCRNNPIMRIDIGGLYDFESINNWSNPVIAVFPIEGQRDDAIQDDYQAAHDAAVPIITVTNIADLAEALTDLSQKGVPFDCIAINSHGNYDGFRIGSEKVNLMSDLSSLKESLEDKTLFIGACNVGKNELLVSQIAEDTQSTVIAPRHKLAVGYTYDGSELPTIGGERYIPTYSPPQYTRSNGTTTNYVTNVTLDKNNGIKWNGKYFFQK